MKKILYISLLLTLLASCTKMDLLNPKGNGATGGGVSPIGITDPDKDDDHDGDSGGGITDPDKNDDRDKDGNKNLGKLK